MWTNGGRVVKKYENFVDIIIGCAPRTARVRIRATYGRRYLQEKRETLRPVFLLPSVSPFKRFLSLSLSVALSLDEFRPTIPLRPSISGRGIRAINCDCGVKDCDGIFQ